MRSDGYHDGGSGWCSDCDEWDSVCGCNDEEDEDSMIELSATLEDGRLFKTRGFDLNQKKAWSMFAHGATRILGVHVYSRRVAEGVYSVVLRVSNAACKADGSGFAGKTYFDWIALDLAPGLVARPLVRRAGSDDKWLVAPMANATDAHVMLPGASFVRRYLVGTPKALAIYQTPPKLVPRIVADFGPWGLTLPSVDRNAAETRCAGELSKLCASLGWGAADFANDVRTKALGPYQPAGSDLAYEHGGQGIHPVYGYGQSPSCTQYSQIQADLWIERSTVACYDIDTGEPITSEDWAKAHSLKYQPFHCIASGDEEQTDPNTKERRHYPPALVRPAFNAGSCPYEQAITNYDTPDDAHAIRMMGHAMASVELTGDACHRDFLMDVAHHFRRTWCDIGMVGPWIYSLSNSLNAARKNPGQGMPISRGFGWAALACANGMKYAPDPKQRACFEAQGEAFLELHRISATPCGFTQNAAPRQAFPEAWDLKIIPEGTHGAQCFEQAYVTFGIMGILVAKGRVPTSPPGRFRRLLTPQNRNLSILIRAAKSSWANPALKISGYDDGSLQGRPKYIDPRTANPKGYGGADPSNAENALAMLFRSSGDAVLLRAALDTGRAASNSVYDHIRYTSKMDRARMAIDADARYGEWGVLILAELEALTARQAVSA